MKRRPIADYMLAFDLKGRMTYTQVGLHFGVSAVRAKQMVYRARRLLSRGAITALRKAREAT
jgi:hypothetical protein